jgi:23S rRNA (uracil1939-C5)-methyltransferase
VVEVDRCRIALDRLWAVLPDLRTFLERSPLTVGGLSEVEIFQGDGEGVLIDLKLKTGGEDLSILKRDLLAGGSDWESRPVSLYLSRSQKRTLRVSGPGFVHKTVGEWTFRVSRGSFFQINEFMLETLSRRATHGLAGSRALDLFCGVGFFTLPLSTKFGLVWAVDQSAAAILDMEVNARTNGRRNCRIFHRDLDAFLRDRRRDLEEVDLILLDPPRSGIPKTTVGRVADLKASRIVYVSCDPSTLARDLAIILGRGYEIESLEIVDLFPHSHHLETIARLKRMGG